MPASFQPRSAGRSRGSAPTASRRCGRGSRTCHTSASAIAVTEHGLDSDVGPGAARVMQAEGDQRPRRLDRLLRRGTGRAFFQTSGTWSWHSLECLFPPIVVASKFVEARPRGLEVRHHQWLSGPVLRAYPIMRISPDIRRATSVGPASPNSHRPAVRAITASRAFADCSFDDPDGVRSPARFSCPGGSAMNRRTSDGRPGREPRARNRRPAACRDAAAGGPRRGPRRIGLADQKRPGGRLVSCRLLEPAVFCRDRTSVRPPCENRDNRAKQFRPPAFGRRRRIGGSVSMFRWGVQPLWQGEKHRRIPSRTGKNVPAGIGTMMS